MSLFCFFNAALILLCGFSGAWLISDPRNLDEEREQNMMETAGEKFLEDYEKEQILNAASISKLNFKFQAQSSSPFVLNVNFYDNGSLSRLWSKIGRAAKIGTYWTILLIGIFLMGFNRQITWKFWSSSKSKISFKYVALYSDLLFSLTFILMMFIYKISGFLLAPITIILLIILQAVIYFLVDPENSSFQHHDKFLMKTGFVNARIVAGMVEVLILISSQSMFKHAGLFMFGITLCVFDAMRGFFELEFEVVDDGIREIIGEKSKFYVAVLVLPCVFALFFLKGVHNRLKKINEAGNSMFGMIA